MKKCTILLVCMIVSFAALAQTSQKDWLVGGNFTINTTTGNSDFTFRPNAGYFFANNFAAGAELLMSFGKTGDTKTSEWGIGPFARYYFLKDAKFKPLVHSSFSISRQTVKDNITKIHNTVTRLYIAGGGAYFINENVALEGLAGYNRSKVGSNGSEGGFRFQLGFQVYLLGK